MEEQTWTKGIPEISGFYWTRLDASDKDLSIVEVLIDFETCGKYPKGIPLIFEIGATEDWAGEYLTNEFFGPIQTPKRS